jgi:hypothetical protein
LTPSGLSPAKFFVNVFHVRDDSSEQVARFPAKEDETRKRAAPVSSAALQRSANQTTQQAQNEQDDEHKEKNLRDTCGARCDSAETQNSRN